METHICQVCNLELEKIESMNPLDTQFSLYCRRCGKYQITNDAQSLLPSFKDKYKLCAWIRDIHERKAEPPKFTFDTIKKLKNSLPDYSPSKKQLILMRNIENLTDSPGRSVNLVPETDYPLAWATCEKELIYFLNSLVDRKLLNLPSRDHSNINNLINVVEISARGWEYLDENSGRSSISDQAFVAMSFSGNIDNAYDNAIIKAIKRAGYTAYRIDRVPHDERIDVKIMAEIKNSRFVVADVTEQKQGVYFEAGYALGLGLPVIWSCREDDFKNRHFDTKQYQHIRWATEDQLREELYNFICAIIGKNTV